MLLIGVKNELEKSRKKSKKKRSIVNQNKTRINEPRHLIQYIQKVIYKRYSLSFLA